MTLDTVGRKVATIPVALSSRFLEHFSEQLYSSPQKAFEELISNGWDAGATIVDVRVDKDLQRENATMAVFDNGTSMDEAGLRELWHIAFSPKEGRTTEHGRPLIGKFGIGKLATYVLAGQLTYICKADDGVIRRVTMDYGDVDSKKGAEPDRLINDLELAVFELDESEVGEALKAVTGGDEILRLIKGEPWDNQDDGGGEESSAGDDGREFGGPPAELERPESETWTLVVLSDLKPTGRDLKLGILRRMLAAALPIGTDMCIRVNGERLRSTKLEAKLLEEWVIGPELEINHIELDETDAASDGDGADGPSDDDAGEVDGEGPTRVEIKVGTSPYPYVEFPAVGRVTGLVRLFEDKISGRERARSEARRTDST